VSYTGGFDPLKRPDHFKKHGARLGIKSEADYEAFADKFLGGLRRFTTLECRRRQGDVIRYDWLTKEFGILSSTGRIHTYYKPDRRIHGKLLHICYFKAECKRIFVI
jgi:pyocin large subunit-like protein